MLLVATLRRNKLIIDECTMVIAFWNMTSTGTKHALNYAKKVRKYSVVVLIN